MLLFIIIIIYSPCKFILVSIHPMLLFILIFLLKKRLRQRCQYIPCYCSSVNQEEPFYHHQCVNTSHVIVHHRDLRKNLDVIECQYIPCYCSSDGSLVSVPCSGVSIHPMLLFISSQVALYTIAAGGVNTSHVIVHLTILRHF